MSLASQQGYFITLEGGEGAGKSTCLTFVEQFLRAKGLPVLVTREPGGTELGERLRELLLHQKDLDITGDTELLLMFAAREQHLEEVIKPALLDGSWVICDRFTDATYAYQGGGRGVPDERIAVLEAWVQDGFRPDLTLLFDIPVDAGLKRAGNRSVPDRFEQEDHAFQERVRRHYLHRAEQEPARFRVIDAAGSIDEVEAQISAVLNETMA